MNFYYFMSLRCPLQETLAPMQFIERLGLSHALSRADAAAGIDPENPSEADQQRPVRIRLDGAERQMTRAAARDLCNDFLGLARSHCTHCPVGGSPGPCGCVGIVPLPLSAPGEKWLFDRFAPPEPAQSHFLARLRNDGLPTRRHAMLLSSSVECRRSFGAGLPEFTSTQLFYLLLNLKQLDAETRLRLVYEFGAVKARPAEIDTISGLIARAPADGALAGSPELEAIRKALNRFKVRMKYEKSDDESIAALKQYFLFGLQSLTTGIPMYASLM